MIYINKKNIEKSEEELVNTFIPNTDPISIIFLLPVLPMILMMKFHMSMMNQISQISPIQHDLIQQQKTKITSITRTGNTLDIIEKWV